MILLYFKAARSSQIRQFSYDALHRLLSESNPENGVTQYTYDTVPGVSGTGACPTYTFVGKLVQTQDSNGGLICLTYDAIGRLVQKTYGGDPNTDTVGYSYDTSINGGGRLAQAWTCLGSSNPVSCPVANARTAETFAYDTRGNIATFQEATTIQGWTQFNETYDALNRVSSMSVGASSPNLLWEATAWDAEGRVTSVVGSGNTPLQTAATYNLHTAAAPSTSTYSNGDIITKSYNNVGNVVSSSINLGGLGTSVQTDTLVWNANGSLGSLSRQGSVGTNDVFTYHYDDLERLTSASDSPTVNQLNQAFTYDMFDNITHFSGNPNMFMNGVDANTNHLTSPTNCQSQQSGPCYDAKGQTIFDEFNRSYTWDVNGKLVAHGTGTTYVNDAFGRMVDDTNFQTSFWPPMFTSPWLVPLAHGYSSTITVPLPGGSSSTYGTYSGYQGGFNHRDYLGNTILTAQATQGGGSVFHSAMSYSPFGQPFDVVGTLTTSEFGFDGLYNPLDFQDSFTIPEWKTPARQLDSVAGRWTSPDPARSGWNLYTYAGNNPVNFNDPSGLDDEPAEDAPGQDGNPGTTQGADSIGPDGSCTNGSCSLSFNGNAVPVSPGSGPDPTISTNAVFVLGGAGQLANPQNFLRGIGQTFPDAAHDFAQVMGIGSTAVENWSNSHPFASLGMTLGMVMYTGSDPEKWQQIVSEWQDTPLIINGNVSGALRGSINGNHWLSSVSALTEDEELGASAMGALKLWRSEGNMPIDEAIYKGGGKNLTNYFNNVGSGFRMSFPPKFEIEPMLFKIHRAEGWCMYSKMPTGCQ